MNMDYWKDCIVDALEDADLTATQKQIQIITAWVESAFENYGMATGRSVASSNFRAAEASEKEELRQRLNYEQTVPRNRCQWCSGHGYTTDGWGRKFGCRECDGKGSTPLYPFRRTA